MANCLCKHTTSMLYDFNVEAHSNSLMVRDHTIIYKCMTVVYIIIVVELLSKLIIGNIQVEILVYYSLPYIFVLVTYCSLSSFVTIFVFFFDGRNSQYFIEFE